MPSYLTAFVRSSRLVGIVGTGLLAGHSLALSETVISVLTSSTIRVELLAMTEDRLVSTVDHLAITWLLHRADGLVRPILIGSVVALLVEGAYGPYTPAATTFLGLTPARQLVIAAITTFSALGYTAPVPYTIWVQPVMNRLSFVSGNVEVNRSMSENPDVSEEVVQIWGTQTAFRAMLFGTAFVLALTAV
ncbi:hypothetical protein M407DRAFT_125658 [Tulasnella calospora MUT 4182]|uniref:Uncharacterized protein n=1 Tax=Tulasnella calospora MUT 4182 TaxID=1051891 RepID=A0A0C3KJ61_9AGAM|nr:hypothetical protein M407DRAFT_125658 [Tulasnella calospora MUT 4182]